MPRVAPFPGLRYDTSVAGPLDRLTAPPYDVISDPHRAGYLDASAFNVVHVDLAEGSDDPAAPDNRYERAAMLLDRWELQGVLVRAPEPHFYAYEVAWTAGDAPAGTLRGVFVAMTLEPWGGSVVPHEHTMPGPVTDRLHLLRATRTHMSPIYGTVAGPCPDLTELLTRTSCEPPSEQLVDDEGVTHRLWEVSGDEPIDRWLANEDLLIADGHHRYTTALAYRDERHAADGPGPWDAILTFVVDSGSQHVPVLPYHRVQMAGSPPTGGEPVGGLEDLQARVRDDELRLGTITRSADGHNTYRLLHLHGDPPTVRALHDEMLDARAPGDSLRFTHSAADADEAVGTGAAVAAYILPPTTPERIRAAILRGDRLPRKSTFFWPKPRTGLIFMPVR